MRALLVGLTLFAPLALAGSATSGPLVNLAIETASPAQLTQWREESRYCRRLRKACEYKDERGETGEGNCRRYRRECR